MQFEIVGVNRDRWIFEVDDHFNSFSLRPGVKDKQRMFVQAELL
jgi:hypothetical protein